MPERESGACGTGFSGMLIEQLGYLILGGGGWLLGIRLRGLQPHAVVSANFVAILEVFDPIHPLGGENKRKGFVGDEYAGCKLVNMVIGKVLAENMASDTVSANSLESKNYGDVDNHEHVGRNTTVGEGLPNTHDTLLGGEAPRAYLVVALCDGLNQILRRVMDEPCGFMRNENRGYPSMASRFEPILNSYVR